MLIKNIFNYLKKKDFYILDFSNKFSIFKILILGKLFLLPFAYLFISFFDNRNNSIFRLADLVKYNDISILKSIFNFGSWESSNAGFTTLIYTINKVTNNNLNLNLLLNAFISLILMSLAQTIILNYVFLEKAESDKRLKLTSLFLSIINFYILIYSFKPSTDVFGCLGIIIFIVGFIKINKSNSGALIWFLEILIIALFRNTLFILIPIIGLSKKRHLIINEIKRLKFLNKFLILNIIGIILSIGIFQIAGQANIYNIQQSRWGLSSLAFENNLNLSQNLFSFLKFILQKIIFTLGAREAVGMHGNWFINEINGFAISQNVLITNIFPAIFLIFTNTLGIISIFKTFSSKFKSIFLTSLITLLPVISFAAHHRYFLPFALVTNACLPFIISPKQKVSSN